MSLLVELWRLKTAIQSPIPIEPMHLFLYCHLRQRQMARGCLHTYNNRVAQDGAHTCQHALLASLQKMYWRFILCSIDSCQFKVSADHITGSGWNSSRSSSFFVKLTADQFVDFHWIAGSSIFPNY